MRNVTSKDGTSIAFDQAGSGPALILIGGAFSYRAFPGFVQLATLLSPHFTVINYDRRGRGDSSDTAPYAVEREIEDLDALIKAVSESAFVWGMSSGAVLALRAAASGLNIKKLALYEPPFILDNTGPLPPADLTIRLNELLASNRRGEAVRYFMTKGMGVPAIFMIMLRLMPMWSKLKALVHTTPYDIAVMGDTITGKPLPASWVSVTMPTLVIDGEKSPAVLRHAAQALANALPNARHHTLAGQSHNVSMKALAPVLQEFFTI